MVSIILPVYNEEKMVQKSADIISDILRRAEILFEIVFVNDGSKDRTWSEIEQVSEKNENIHGIGFSRNFGKESAILAGLAYAKGDCCVIMDCDLQHPPETIIEMYRLWEEGFEVVEGVKASRGKEGFFHKFAALTFYKIISKATRIDMQRASDFKLLDRKAVDVLLDMPEKQVFFRALSSWIGFESTMVEYDVRERAEGASKWSTRSLIKYAVTNITSFSAVPLQFATSVGFLFLLFTVIFAAHTLYKYISGQALEGFTTVILLLLIIGSVCMISLGIIGYYVAKIYEEVKGRPRYIVSKSTYREEKKNGSTNKKTIYKKC